MRRFESVVMSETEPVSHGTLWLRPKRNTLSKKGYRQFDIWYFSESGWTPIADYDTRYNFKVDFQEDASIELPLEIISKINPEVGIVDDLLIFRTYDGSRELFSSNNFVLESALYKHVKLLKDKINNNTDEIKELKETISTLTDKIKNLESTLGVTK